jgi:shikimate kinase
MKARPDSLARENSSASEKFPVVRAACLVGFMGAGKSSVGAALAEHLGWPFVDLDERIQSRETLSIEEIFQQSGEAEFRRMEHAALRDLLEEATSAPAVIALGGGAFVQPGNAMLLKDANVVTVFLDAPVDELFRRCQEQAVNRPLRRDREQFGRLHQERLPAYATALLRVDTGGKNVDTVVAEVASGLKSKGVRK